MRFMYNISIINIVPSKNFKRGVCHEKKALFPILHSDRHSRMQSGFINVYKLISP